MFHGFDNPSADKQKARTEWMGLLARAPLDFLEETLTPYLMDQPHWLRRPETGLMMVQARTGGQGQRFNLGELTVTRCALRLSDKNPRGPVGVAYVKGRSHRHARLAAHADALLQDDDIFPVLQVSLLMPLRKHLQQERDKRHTLAQSSKVDFMTVAREIGDTDEKDAP